MQNNPILILLLILVAITGCAPDKSRIERIKHDGKLIVVTHDNPTTYYDSPFGPAGLEYDLATLFAQHLGVELELIIEQDHSKIFTLLKIDKVDIAAGLTKTDLQKEFVKFGPSYMEVTQQVAYRIDNKIGRPRKIEDLIGANIKVAAHSPHAETLATLSKDYTDLSWHESQSLGSDELLRQVWLQSIDYTITNSIEIKLKQRFYPGLFAAFDIGKHQSLAWAMHMDIDDSLYNETVVFFSNIKQNGTLKQLINKHYGHVKNFNYVDARNFKKDIASKLPNYINIFKLSAHAQNLDWRLLAAVGYQESHWNSDAVSPTGVRGIMMLTSNTAKFVGITNRRDPIQSIEGGAKYLRYMIDNIPDQITEPDRTWMALAAYNVGYGHLEDARKITQKRGKDPDKWIDVKKNLPLLSQKEWYSKAKYGYARGQEPVDYVSNIRNYYELLIWHDESNTYKQKKPPAPISIGSPSL